MNRSLQASNRHLIPDGNAFRLILYKAKRFNDQISTAKLNVGKVAAGHGGPKEHTMIRKLPSGKYRLYSRKKNPKTGRRRNLGTFNSRAAAEKHERAVQYFKRH